MGGGGLVSRAISLSAGWRDNPVFGGAPLSKAEAWLWLIENAGDDGGVSASVRDMAEAWEWSKSTVDRYVQDLRNCEMLGTGDKNLSICNIEKHLCECESAGTAKAARISSAEIDEVAECWNTAAKAKGWNQIRKLSPSRRAKLAARLKEHGLDGVKEAMRKAYRSPLISGPRVPTWWSFDWLTKNENNILKVLEGNYDRNFNNERGTANRDDGQSSNPLIRAAVRSQQCADLETREGEGLCEPARIGGRTDDGSPV